MSNKGDSTVTVFNDLSKVTNVAVGSLPKHIAVDAAGKVYVSNYIKQLFLPVVVR